MVKNNLKFKHLPITAIFLFTVSIWIGSAFSSFDANPFVFQQAAATLTPVVPIVLSQPVDDLTIQRDMNPKSPVTGQPANVELTLNFPKGAACQGIPGQPVDAMFVFDISTSAGVGPGSNWETTLGFTRALLANLAQPVFQNATTSGISKVGLVSTQTGTRGPEPVLLQPLTDDQDILDKALSGMAPSGDTDIAAGLATAEKSLLGAKIADRSQAIVIFLHDNVALNDGTLKAIAEIMSRNIPVFIVVNSLNIDADKQINQDLAAQAVPSDQVFIDPNPLQVHTIFIAASRGSQTLAARAISIAENYSPDGQVDLINPSTDGQVSGQMVQWHLPQVQAGAQNLSYQLNLKNTNVSSLAVDTSVSWIDCNGYPHTRMNTTGDIQGSNPTVVADQPSGQGSSGTSSTRDIEFSSRDLGIPFLMGLPGLPDWLWFLLLLLLLLLLLMWLLRLLRKPAKVVPVPPPGPYLGPKYPIIPPTILPTTTQPDNTIKSGVTTQYVQLDGGKKYAFMQVEPKFADPVKFLAGGGKIVVSRWIKPSDNTGPELARIVFETEKITTQNKLTGENTTRTISNITQLSAENHAAGVHLLNQIIADAKSLGSKELRYELPSNNNDAVRLLLSEQNFDIDELQALKILK